MEWPGGVGLGAGGGAGRSLHPQLGCSIRGHGSKLKVRTSSLKPKGEAWKGKEKGFLCQRVKSLGLDPSPRARAACPRDRESAQGTVTTESLVRAVGNSLQWLTGLHVNVKEGTLLGFSAVLHQPYNFPDVRHF